MIMMMMNHEFMDNNKAEDDDESKPQHNIIKDLFPLMMILGNGSQLPNGNH